MVGALQGFGPAIFRHTVQVGFDQRQGGAQQVGQITLAHIVHRLLVNRAHHHHRHHETGDQQQVKLDEQTTHRLFPAGQGEQIAAVAHGLDAERLGGVVAQLLRRREMATSMLRSSPS
jgi:hypothetical protein